MPALSLSLSIAVCLPLTLSPLSLSEPLKKIMYFKFQNAEVINNKGNHKKLVGKVNVNNTYTGHI